MPEIAQPREPVGRGELGQLDVGPRQLRVPFVCPTELQAKAWPTEDYQLARSRVESVTPEDDLFAGIRGSS